MENLITKWLGNQKFQHPAYIYAFIGLSYTAAQYARGEDDSTTTQRPLPITVESINNGFVHVYRERIRGYEACNFAELECLNDLRFAHFGIITTDSFHPLIGFASNKKISESIGLTFPKRHHNNEAQVIQYVKNLSQIAFR